MRALIRAEFRKISTTNLWWAMLIPVVVLAFCAGWLGTAFVGIIDTIEQFQATLPLGLLSVSLSTNVGTIFALLFGAMTFAGEFRNRTITTTYLTANPRGAVLAAKLITCGSVGVVYGLANVLFASFGALLGAGPDLAHFGSVDDWLRVGGAGLLSMLLWSLLGVGFGALVPNAVLVIIAPLVYKFVIEFTVSISVMETSLSGIGPYLPGAAGNGIVSNLAVPLFVSAVAGPNEPNTPRGAFELLHLFFGGTYDHPWWLSLLTFLLYTAAFVAGAWFVGRRRDVA